MDKIPVIIDCDPGHDDALMLMLAFGSGKFDVQAVTVSAGNQTQEKTLRNALKILTLIRADVPVFRGEEKPIAGTFSVSGEVHGESGLDGTSLPEPGFAPEPVSAAEGIASMLEKAPKKLTIVATGPLTNVATFLISFPHLHDRIDRISLMGGGIFRGNMTPLAEFNVFMDPEAAAIVFRSGVPITMCGLDVTHKALVFQEDINELKSIGNLSGAAAGAMMDFFSIYYRKNRIELLGGTALHDPCAIAWLIAPQIFEAKECYVDVETKGELTRGATVVDFYNVLGKNPNALVCYDINREAYLQLIFDAIRNLP